MGFGNNGKSLLFFLSKMSRSDFMDVARHRNAAGGGHKRDAPSRTNVQCRTDGNRTVYTGIMSGPLLEGGPAAPASRGAQEMGGAAEGRRHISVHSAVCVVNSKAADTTRNTAVCADIQ